MFPMQELKGVAEERELDLPAVRQVQANKLENSDNWISAILRSDMSILIPSAAIGRAEQVRSLLAYGDMKAVVTKAMEGVKRNRVWCSC